MHDPTLNGHRPARGRSPGSRKCNCCPFGYHLDLDFVRYCEKVANSKLLQSTRNTLPRVRHSKKKRESIESLLGLLPPTQQQVDTENEKSYTIKGTGTIFSEDLEKAVSDFERIFNSSARSHNSVSDEARDHSGALEIELLKLQKDMFKTPGKNIFQSQLEPLVSDSKQNGISNANSIVLQDIRYQMAASLTKLRRLEEEVKVIPNLELQVNTLRLENDRLKKCVKNNFEKRLKEQIKDNEKRGEIVHTRTIGTGCSVLSRDVGVSNHVVFSTEETHPVTPPRLIDRQTNTHSACEYSNGGKSLQVLLRSDVGTQVEIIMVKPVKLCQTDDWPLKIPTRDTSVQSDSLPINTCCQFESPLTKPSDSNTNKCRLKNITKFSVSTQFDGPLKQTGIRKNFGAQIKPTLSDKEISVKYVCSDTCTQTIEIFKTSVSCNVNMGSKSRIGVKTEPDKSNKTMASKFTDTNDICKTAEIGVNTIKSMLINVSVDTEGLKENIYNETKRITPTEDNRYSAISNSFQQLKINENLASSEELREKTSPAITITSKPYEKKEPSKEMKGAMKVLNDNLLKSPSGEMPKNMRNAVNIIQQEWFRVSSTAEANPLEVEDYLDCFEEFSVGLLEYIVNMTDVSGNTAMHYAVSNGNFDVVSILLDSKVCNINKLNTAGYTCIMLVALTKVKSETDKQVVKRLFHIADVNIRARQHGQTALMLAVSHGRIETVELLLESGADINIQDEDGSTALMCAAEHGYIDIVKLLLAQPDCDLSVTDLDGNTALNIAMEAGNRDIGVLLYAQEHFSRGSSPYSTLKHRRGKSSTPTLKNRTPTPPTCSQEYSL